MISRPPFFLLIFNLFGGFLFWSLKGLKTKITTEFSDKFLLRNILTGIIFVSMVVLIFYFTTIKSNSVEDKIKQPVMIMKIKKDSFIIVRQTENEQ